MSNQPTGAWVAYNMKIADVALFESEADALRHARERGMPFVAFWEFGKALHEVGVGAHTSVSTGSA